VDTNTSGAAQFLRALSIYTVLDESMPFVFSNSKLVVNSELIIGAPLRFQGACSIEGNNNIIDVTNAGVLTVAPNSSLLLKNMTLKGVGDSVITCFDTTGTVQLHNVTWVQSSTTTFATGSLQINGEVLFAGTSPFVYQSNQPCTVQSNATWIFDTGMTFSYAPFSNNNNLIQLSDSSSVLYFNAASLFASAVGMQLTKGTVVVDGPCVVTNNGLNSGQGISFGDGVSIANNCVVKILPESGFILNSGFLVNNNV
jgi:hypothetical protein